MPVGLQELAEALNSSSDINEQNKLVNNNDMYWKRSASGIYHNASNVGIGTKNPEYKLDVYGDINCSGILFSKDLSVKGKTNLGNSLSVKGSTQLLSSLNVSEKTRLAKEAVLSSTLSVKGKTYIEGSLSVKDATHLLSSLNVSEKTTLAKETVLSSTLSVKSETHLNSTLNINGNILAELDKLHLNKHNGSLTILLNTGNGVNRQGNYLRSMGPGQFSELGIGKLVNASTSGTIQKEVEFIRLKENGNLGIGTENPTEKLHINDGNVLINNNIKFLPQSSTQQNFVGNAPINTEEYRALFGSSSLYSMRDLNHIQLTGGDNGSQSIIFTSGGSFQNQVRNIQGFDTLDIRKSVTPLSINALGGNVGIGIVGPSEKLELSGVIKINSTSEQVYAHNGLLLTNTTNNKSYRIYVNNDSAHDNFHIQNLTTGNLVYLSTANSWYHTSDDRLKHNEVDITNGLKVIMRLKPQIYNKTNKILDENFNGNLDDLGIYYHKEVGFIAQDVYEIDELKHIIDTGDEETKWCMEYNTIIPYNTAAIQELKSEKDELENKVVILESNIVKLENKNNELEQKYNDLLARISALEGN